MAGTQAVAPPPGVQGSARAGAEFADRRQILVAQLDLDLAQLDLDLAQLDLDLDLPVLGDHSTHSRWRAFARRAGHRSSAADRLQRVTRSLRSHPVYG